MWVLNLHRNLQKLRCQQSAGYIHQHGAAFLSHVRHQRLPRVTTAQQKCHTGNGTADSLAFNSQSLTHISLILFLYLWLKRTLAQKSTHIQHLHSVRLWAKILRCTVEQQQQQQWWKTLGVSLGVGRLDLFALCCHYLASLLASNICAGRNMNLQYYVWHLCAHGRAKYVMHCTAM